MKPKAFVERLRRLPGWALFLLASFAWLFAVEMGCYLWLLSLRDNLNHPISFLLHGMVDQFHPLFKTHGHFSASNYYPYIAAYKEGDWSGTPPPPEAQLHPDGWVLPNGKDAGGKQLWVSPIKAPGTIRVIVLGGSTMVGMGQSSPEKNIPNQIQRLLRGRFPERKIEVVNGAFYTHIAAQEFAAFSTKLILFDPDLILALDGYNELVRAYHYPGMPPFWSLPHEQMYRTYSRVQSFKGTLAQLGFLLSKRFYFLAVIRAMRYNRRYVRSAPSEEKPFDPKPYERNLDEYMTAHRNMIGVAREHGIPLLLAAQPALMYRKPRSGEEKTIVSERNSQKPGWGPATDYFYERLDRRYEAFIKEKSRPGVRLLNLTGLFEREGGTLYIDPIHYNDRGAEFLAEALAAEAAKSLGLEK